MEHKPDDSLFSVLGSFQSLDVKLDILAKVVNAHAHKFTITIFLILV